MTAVDSGGGPAVVPPKEVVGAVGHGGLAPGVQVPAGATPPVVLSLWIHVVCPSRPGLVSTACRSSQAMFPVPPGALCVRAASTELPP